MSSYRQFLVAVDFSGATKLVCERAVELALHCEATVTLVHVVEPIIVDPIYEALPAIPMDFEARQLELARNRLRGLSDRYGFASERCRVEIGSTRTEILRVAEEINADLIVLGSHGRSGVSRLLGSTVSSVLHAAQRDVLAVRIKENT
jgi:universal stress protein A